MIKMCGAYNYLTLQVVEKTQVFFFQSCKFFEKSTNLEIGHPLNLVFLDVLIMELWGPFCLLIKAVCCILFLGSGAATKSYVGYIV